MRLAYFALAVAACADAGDLATDNTDVDADVTTQPNTELSVRTGETTVWVRRDLVRTGDTFVLHGRTSRTLTDGNAFVFDDPYGELTHPSSRTFEISWQLSELRTLADGVDQFVSLGFAHSANRPDRLTARAVVRPRLASFTGSSKLYLTAAFEPVVVAGVTVYRLSGHTTEDNTEVTAKSGDNVFAVTRAGARNFIVDFTPEQAFALTADGDLVLWAYVAGGGVTKHARLGLELAKLGLTADDAYSVWPRPTCTSSVKTCLTSLPDGALDLGTCGEAIKVNACRGAVGVVIDDVAMQAALHDTDTLLAAPPAHADAVALAGGDQANAFLFGAKQTVESRYEQMFGRWYVSNTARSSQLADARAAALDSAYARPLDSITPHPVHVGDAAAMRQVAADAVLAQIATQDFLHSDLSRTVEQLVHDARAQHVTDIGAFRTTIMAQPYPGTPAWDVYTGSWLQLYTEVVIERATGHVVRTLVEID